MPQNGTRTRPAAIPQPALRGVPARLRDARRAPGGDARAPLGPTDVRPPAAPLRASTERHSYLVPGAAGAVDSAGRPARRGGLQPCAVPQSLPGSFAARRLPGTGGVRPAARTVAAGGGVSREYPPGGEAERLMQVVADEVGRLRRGAAEPAVAWRPALAPDHPTRYRRIPPIRAASRIGRDWWGRPDGPWRGCSASRPSCRFASGASACVCSKRGRRAGGGRQRDAGGQRPWLRLHLGVHQPVPASFRPDPRLLRPLPALAQLSRMLQGAACRRRLAALAARSGQAGLPAKRSRR
ncbi:transcriptional regulator [Pseudomonas aeruginosa]|nr:transcriptional regulator [Pseudomonas aeruginosa]